MDKPYKIIILILVAIIVIGFFLPWVNVESKQVGTITKILTGKRQATVEAISGFRIPLLANSEDARLIISVARTFYPDITGLDKKSYLVWLFPVVALIILGIALNMENNKLTNIIFGAIGVAVFVLAVYKINETDLDRLVLQMKIGLGLWASLWGYLGIGVLGFFSFVASFFQKKAERS